MAKKMDRIVQEEQEALDKIIEILDRKLLELNRGMTEKQLIAKKAMDKCLPDTYGMLIDANNSYYDFYDKKRQVKRSRDELYDTHVILDSTLEGKTDELDLMVGLHSFGDKGNQYIISWKMEMCRPLFLDDMVEEYDAVVNDKRSKKQYKSHFKVKQRRKVTLDFDIVEQAIQLLPVLNEKELERVLADTFLQELLRRRSDPSFQNIVFSIQKKQGEIIKTPFRKNMIVQGCAGSGKSMIMLHRLPIIIYDNPDSLDRNNLFIITPSETYIQMANNMRIDLEIADLKMGTLKDYYEYVLEKYHVDPEVYGPIDPIYRIPDEMEAYIYSEKCTADIKAEFERLYKSGIISYKTARELLGIAEIRPKSDTYFEKAKARLLEMEKVVNENEYRLRQYFTRIIRMLDVLDELARMLSSRKLSTSRKIDQLISEQREEIKKAQRELEKLNPETSEVAITNRNNQIEVCENKIQDLLMKKAELDALISYDTHFRALRELATEITKFLKLFVNVRKQWERVEEEKIYWVIEQIPDIINFSNTILEKLVEYGDPFYEYGDPINEFLKNVKRIQGILEESKEERIAYQSVVLLREKIDFYKWFVSDGVKDVYESIMRKIAGEADEKKKIKALSCSPYLYLRTIYQFQGAPNARCESLITIDEAQNLSVEEYKLIRSVNKNKAVFNLFGDIKQHVEGRKGIDSWNQVKGIAPFALQEMNQNYRNARQITDYCNKRFGMHMEAINLDSAGVHTVDSELNFKNTMVNLLKKPMNPGISCILVKDIEEAKTIKRWFSQYSMRISDMSSDAEQISTSKWNIITIDRAKGLEFGTVVAVSGRMTENEKYIAYTRALDELYVFETVIEGESGSNPIEEANNGDEKKNVEKPERPVRQKREKRPRVSATTDEIQVPDITLVEFLKSRKIDFIDARSKSNYLWIIGTKEAISDVVNEIISIYNISGTYSKGGKITGFREGWFTNSKK